MFFEPVFDHALLSLMQEQNIPGLSIVVLDRYAKITHHELGVKDVKTRAPIELHTVFEAASLSKPVIAYTALFMCQRGLLELDVSLLSYIQEPYFGNPQNLEEVTLRHVLTHTSGFAATHVKPREKLQLDGVAGEKFLYSGESFCFLAHVMQARISIPLEEYIQREVFRPLQMEDSSFIWQERYETQAALPHDQEGKLCEKWKPKQLVGSCSLHTTPRDFAKFMIHLMTNPVMFEKQLAIGDGLAMCLGWWLEETEQGTFVWHSGDNGTFRALAIVQLESGSGFVMMTNGANGAKLCPMLISHFLKGDHEKLLEWEQFASDEILDPEFLGSWWKVLQLDRRNRERL